MVADVVVAGAGPAGAAAAHYLARAGADVVVLERARFPRDKSCGDGVTPHAIAILADMGVTFAPFEGRGVRVYGGAIAGPSGGFFEAEPKPPPPEGGRWESWIVPRVHLDAEIAAAAVRAGARLHEGVAVTSIVRDARGRPAGVETSDGNGVRRIAAKVIVGADGAHSAVARSLGLRDNPSRHLGYALRAYYTGVTGLKDAMELHYYSRGMLPGYGWVFPTGAASANVGIGIYLGELRRTKKKMRDLLDDFVATAPHVRERFVNAVPVGRAIGWPLPVSSARRRSVFDGVLLAGDAASLVDPLTGEGIWTALVSGRSAARAAARAVQTGDASQEALWDHEREWRTICDGYLGPGRALKNLAKSAWLFDRIVDKAGSSEYYASRAIAYGLGILERKRALRSIVAKAIFNPRFFRS